jgi:hypothetical protein
MGNIAVLKRGEESLMPYALCPMPYALCPMPYALCRPRIFRLKGYTSILHFHLSPFPFPVPYEHLLLVALPDFSFV